MSNKTQLQQNNTDLREIQATINDLPDFLDTRDADATAADIATGKTAYVNGEKVAGTHVCTNSYEKVNITITSGMSYAVTVLYMKNGKHAYSSLSASATITISCDKNSLLAFAYSSKGFYTDSSVTGDISQAVHSSSPAFYVGEQDSSMTIS